MKLTNVERAVLFHDWSRAAALCAVLWFVSLCVAYATESVIWDALTYFSFGFTLVSWYVGYRLLSGVVSEKEDAE